jgi:hypothetical protein
MFDIAEQRPIRSRSATAPSRATSRPAASTVYPVSVRRLRLLPPRSILPARLGEHIVELRADRELAVTTDAADWVINNIDDQLGAFTTVHDRLRTDLEAMPADTRAAVEDAGRELRKARAAAFIPVDSDSFHPRCSRSGNAGECGQSSCGCGQQFTPCQGHSTPVGGRW